ncbi:hypothetical protein CMI37_37390 [Candidatus Pacearchaeota archaeon]|nr:hypothetical protein [Candidatus Pacearchaeota archaeon]
MAGVNIGNVGLTFTRFLDGVVETLNHTSKSRNLVRKDDNWTGSHIEGRIHTARSTAIGYVEDGGAFPTADKQDYATYKAFRKFIVGSIQLTDGAMATASKSPNVARDVITSEVKGMMNNILKFENGMFFRDGTGTVATLAGTPASISSNVEVDDARMLWDGGTYEVRDSADITTLHGSNTLSSVESAVNSSGNMETSWSSALPAAAASGDFLVWSGSVNRAITGLDKLIGDSLTGTFQSVTMSSNPRYTSLVLENNSVNRDLTPSLFRQMLAGIMSRTGSERPADGLTVLCNSWQAINVEELYEGELRLTPESKVGGLSVASFQSSLGRIDIMVDTDCLYNKMFFADFSKIYRAVQKQLGWRREGGSIFKRSDVAGVWTATAMEIAELYIKERNTCGKIVDLNETKSTAY